MSPISHNNVPTLTSLYGDKSLKAIPASDYEYSANINDRVGLLKGDIAAIEVDAIVNAASPSLAGLSGVDKAIHQAAGPELANDCKAAGACKTGDVVSTKGHNLPANFVIHAVGPKYKKHSEDAAKALLSSCYDKALAMAVNEGWATVAFPCISTGVYEFPHEEAAKVALEAVRVFLSGADGNKLDKVIFVTHGFKDHSAYKAAIPKFFPGEGEQQAGEA